MRILISGARAPVCLELLRIFSSAGHEVSICDSISYPLTRFSFKFKKFFKFPPPKQKYAEFKNCILQIQKAEKFDLIIPTCEEAFYFSKLKTEENIQEIFCDEFPKMISLHNKWDFYKLSQDWSIQVPESYLLKSLNDWQNLKKPSQDFVFKPAFSRFAIQTLIGPQVSQLAVLNDGADWLAQKKITGLEICVYAVCVNGELKAFSAYTPTYRVGVGAGIYLSSHFDLRIKQFCEEFAKQVQYHGQVAFDIIHHPGTNKLWLLECNPRSTSGIHFFDPTLASRFFNPAAEPLIIQKSKPQMLAGAMALYGIPWSLSLSKWTQFFHDFSKAHDVMWDIKDPGPSLGQYLAFSVFIFQGLLSRQSPQCISTRDIEFNGT